MEYFRLCLQKGFQLVDGQDVSHFKASAGKFVFLLLLRRLHLVELDGDRPLRPDFLRQSIDFVIESANVPVQKKG